MRLARHTDSKGRITLGQAFANRLVTVDQLPDGEMHLVFGGFVPDRELWLYRNPTAKASVAAGLRQAAAGEFSHQPPDLEADAALAERLEDD